MSDNDRTICYVKWIDSSVLNEQIEPHEAPKPVEVASVGFVVAESCDFITLTRDLIDDGDLRGCVSIPKVAVLEHTALRMPADGLPERIQETLSRALPI